jgi:hypothetical protein
MLYNGMQSSWQKNWKARGWGAAPAQGILERPQLDSCHG